jgi:hypothetical protein
MRGSGLSDRVAAVSTLEQRIGDLRIAWSVVQMAAAANTTNYPPARDSETENPLRDPSSIEAN